jgi:type IV pilus assembly protein PilC
MVKAGETGGILDDILKKLATQQEKDAAIKHKLKSAMSYPMVLIVIMTIAFFVLTIFVIPKIGKMIKDLSSGKAELPVYTKAMLAFSDFMVSYWWVLIIIIALSIFAFRHWVQTPKGRFMFHKILLKIPVIKTVVTKVAVARFSRIFASLMSSGVPVTESIDITAEALGNKVIEKELKEAGKDVVNGKQLSEPLAESEIFPPIVSQMLAVGEETGQTDTILIKVADFYEEEVDSVVDSLASIIEPLMILLMGGMVGLIAASVIGPISSLAQNI